MNQKLLRVTNVTGRPVCAGAVWGYEKLTGWSCLHAAPILHWMVGMTDVREVRQRLDKLGMVWSWVDGEIKPGFKDMKPLLQYTRRFWCETCGQKDPLTVSQLKEHLKMVHGLEVVKGSKQARMCVDMEGGQYENTYDWLLPGKVKVTEVAAGTKVRS